jgi:hypothetical protein
MKLKKNSLVNIRYKKDAQKMNLNTLLQLKYTGLGRDSPSPQE